MRTPPKEQPNTRLEANDLQESITCIYCRIGQAYRTKEGLFFCSNCGRYQQRGFSEYTILPQR